MTPPPDLADNDALIATLLARIEALTATNALLMARVIELEAKLGLPPKTPDNSSVPPSKGQKPSEANSDPASRHHATGPWAFDPRHFQHNFKREVVSLDKSGTI